MAARTVRLRVEDIRRAIAEIESAMIVHAGIEHSWLFRRGIERGLEIISEASRSLPHELKSKATHIDWVGMAAFGNIARHGYDSVDWILVLASAKHDLPPLRDFLDSLGEEDLELDAADRR